MKSIQRIVILYQLINCNKLKLPRVELCWLVLALLCYNRLSQITTFKMITLCERNFTFSRKRYIKQEKEPDTNFVNLRKKYDCSIYENAFPKTNQGSAIFHTWENSKMFKIISKYFSFFKNMPPVFGRVFVRVMKF